MITLKDIKTELPSVQQRAITDILKKVDGYTVRVSEYARAFGEGKTTTIERCHAGEIPAIQEPFKGRQWRILKAAAVKRIRETYV